MAIEAHTDAAAAGAVEGVLVRLDAVRGDVAALAAERLRWEVEAREQRRVAEDLAEGLRDLTEQVRRTEEAADRAREEAEARARAAEAERERVADRLRRAEDALGRAQAEAATAAGRSAEEGRRATRLLEETTRLHALQPDPLCEPDTLFDNIIQASVELAEAEKGAFVRPGDPSEVLATAGYDEARSGSPLMDAVARRVAESQEPFVANSPAEVAALAVDPLADSVHNLVGYPIAVKEGLAGVGVVVNKRTGPFTDEDTKQLLGIGGHAGVALENGRLRRELEANHAATVALLCDVVEAKDAYTRGHCEDVAVLTLATARALGLDPREQETAFRAGIVHDVGKIAISDGILLKPGPLLPAERELIETHAAVGADLVAGVPGLRPLAPIVRHHHERWDGAGYPDQLAGEAIPLLSRVVGTVDAYEAMLSERPYRPALGPVAARAELQRGAGSQFDPAVVAAVFGVLDDPSAITRARRDAFADASGPPEGERRHRS